MRDGNYGTGSTGRFVLVKNGTYQLTLSGANCGGYTGGLTVNAGTLDYSSGTLPSNGGSGNFYCPYTVNGGTLNIGSLSASIGLLRVTGGTIAGSGTLTSNTTYDVRAGTINPILAGNVGLNNTGTGLAILGNNDTFTGTTNISAGTLQLGDNSTAGNVAGNIFIDAAGVLNVYHSNAVIFTGKVSGTGTLVKSGNSTLTMSGANAFSGSLTVNGGILDYCGNTAPLPGGNYVVSGGTLDIGTLSQSIGAFQITSGAVTGTGTLTSSSDYDIQGGVIGPVLAGSSGLVKTKDSIAILTGPNTYTGATLIQAGTLALTAGGQIDPSSAIGNDATLLIADGSHSLGVIGGTGSLLVGDSPQLSVTSLVQNTLEIGGDFSSLLGSNSSGSFSNGTVPEPTALVLLASLGAVFAAAYFRKKR
jgi:autotransporter-associated beta strand protein